MGRRASDLARRHLPRRSHWLPSTGLLNQCYGVLSTALERPEPDGTAAVPRVHACDGVLLRGKGFGPKLSDLEWSGKRLQSLPGAVLTAVHTSVMFVVASGTGCTHK